MTDSEFDFLNQYRLLMRLHAESSGLEWGKDGERIRAIAEESDRLRRPLDLPKRDGAPEVGGLYLGAEDLCSVWMAGEIEPKVFAFHMLDFLVREIGTNSSFQLCTVEGAAHYYGMALVEQLFDLADAAMESIEVEWRRFESSEHDEEQEIDVPIVAGLDEADERFDEAPAMKCQPQDEGATQITIVEIDFDHFDGIGRLIEERDRAARRAARGDI